MKQLAYCLICLSSFSVADCIFQVTNYSKWPVTVEAGFYVKPAKNVRFMIPATQTKQAQIKADLPCNYMDLSGLGVTYLNLIGGKSRGGWMYVPASSMIKARGISMFSTWGVIGLASNGGKLFLLNNYKPEPTRFAVVIENSERNISRQLSSMH